MSTAGSFAAVGGDSKCRRHIAERVGERAFAARAKREERAARVRCARRSNSAALSGRHTTTCRLGVVQEVRELRLLVRRIERQKAESGAQHAEIKENALRRFVDLRRDARARGEPEVTSRTPPPAPSRGRDRRRCTSRRPRLRETVLAGLARKRDAKCW